MEEPTEEDCCHSDCKNCVLDIYQKQKKVKPLVFHSKDRTNSIMSETRYRPFKLVKIDTITKHSNVYTFVPAENTSTDLQFYFVPGQHAVLRNNPETSESNDHTSRPYTFIPWEYDEFDCSFSVMIKLYTTGKMSNFIRQWNIGSTTFWRGPYGDFNYQPNTLKKIVMICMGSGIAPMYAIAKYIVDNEDDETTVQLLYGSRTPDDIIFREEIHKMSSYWNFRCTHFISNGYEENQMKYNEVFVNGQMNSESLLTHFKLPVEHNSVLICGSNQFNDDIKNILIENNVPLNNINVFD